jgi:NAD/NADP transhydrogenase beta subunit
VLTPLFFDDDTMVVFGDAEGTVLKIVESIEDLS